MQLNEADVGVENDSGVELPLYSSLRGHFLITDPCSEGRLASREIGSFDAARLASFFAPRQFVTEKGEAEGGRRPRSEVRYL